MKTQPLELADLPLLASIQPPDWQNIQPSLEYYIRSPYAHPIKVTENDELVGIGTTVLHRDTAWLAMIIVNPGHRNKGLGRYITQALINSLDPAQYKTIYLIATPMGEPIYLKLWFEVEAEYVFFKNGNTDFTTSPNIVPFEEKYKAEVLAIDKEVFNENRHYRLAEHLQNGLVYINNGTIEGYYLPTLGEGHIVAQNDTAGTELMKLRLKTNNPFIPSIVPLDNPAAVNFLLDNNYAEVRRAKRMRLGEKRLWHPNKIYNRINGQIG